MLKVIRVDIILLQKLFDGSNFAGKNYTGRYNFTAKNQPSGYNFAALKYPGDLILL